MAASRPFVAGADGGQSESLADSQQGIPEQDAIVFESNHFRALREELARFHPGTGCCRERPVTGLTLSGGGTRAAAFHCGVFWALAAAGQLKDVEHLCAVSGGGYTAASYVTHLCRAAADEPPERDGLDEWYSRVVMRFVMRMQRNINYLVDTTPDRLWRRPYEGEPSEKGSSCCPRVLDLPLFIGALLGSSTASPVLLTLQTLWPFALAVEMVHGARLRSLWCSPARPVEWNPELKHWLLSCSSLGAVLAVVGMVLATMQSARAFPRNAERHWRYLFCRSLQHVVNRWLICYILHVLLVIYVLWQQSVSWGTAFEASSQPSTHHQWVRFLCYAYINGSGLNDATCSDGGGDLLVGSYGVPWYAGGDSSVYLNSTWAASHASPPPGAPDMGAGMPYPGPGASGHSVFEYAAAYIGVSGIILASVGALLWCNAILKLAFTAAGPLGYFFLLAHVIRWKIFGPITSQMLLPGLRYSNEYATILLWLFAAGALLTLPVYDAIQKLAHLYYRRALKRAYFESGRDIEFSTIQNCRYCPNLLFTACLHDYRKPWEGLNHCDFTMSSLFIGCGRTGFHRTPSQASLARLMTIAGAATDATFLLMADVLAIRFFLAVVALRFGDFLRLQPEGPKVVRVQGRVLESLPSQVSVNDGHAISRWLQGLLDRLPAACVFILAHLLLLIGASIGIGSNPESGGRCLAYRLLLSAMVVVVCGVAALGFFAFWKPLQWLMRSPMIQQMLMLCMHRHKAAEPPPYLYISDGGLIEVLGLLPLLRRRLPRVIASDAAEDPELSMRCLRDAFAICRREGLCSFYDLRDPRRDMEFVLRDLREGGESFLHLGIRYEPVAGQPGLVEDGELLYLRMRLPPDDEAPVRPLLEEMELLSAPEAPQSAMPGERLRRDFGGACCAASECGGLCAGRRFPNYGVGNQFLTPLHFANLCALGGELSRPLVQAMRHGLPRSASAPSSPDSTIH